MIYAYLRRSKEENAGSSIDNQRKKILSYCEGADIFVDREFVDFVSGGTKLDQREQGLILSKLLKKGDTINIVPDKDQNFEDEIGIIYVASDTIINGKTETHILGSENIAIWADRMEL